MLTRRPFSFAVLVSGILLGALPAAAQLPSNASLTGTYYFRYLGVNAPTSSNTLAVSALGTMVFDGNGNFTVTGQQYNNSAPGSNQASSLSATGKYAVQSSGTFYMANPFAPSSAGVSIFGGVGTGALVASSTDTQYLDLFVAIPASSGLSNATLSGTYNLGSMEFLNGDFASSRDAFFPISADGKGGLGNVTVSGTAMNLKDLATTQTSAGATYLVNGNGTGTLTFPAPSGVTASNVLISGGKTLYVSGDGNLILGGSATGFDMFVGVKGFTGNPATAFSGIYFTSLLQNDYTGSGLYASEGASNEVGGGNELVFERANYAGYAAFNYDWTYYNSNSAFSSSGLVTYPFSQFALGSGGNVVVGAGVGNFYLLDVYVKAPSLSGSGVFLNPQGAVNAASFAPFEASLSQGEIMTLFGSGLANSIVVAQSLPFPTNLGNVTATCNGVAMPITYVSPTSIQVIVPYSNTASPADGSLVSIQVTNNGQKSNTIQIYSGNSSPGIPTSSQNGIGTAAVLDANKSVGNQVVSASNPVNTGDTIEIFLTGLGPTSPVVAAGSLVPSSPLSLVPTLTQLQVFFDDSVNGYVQGRITYQGLAPGLAAGAYQINVQIPAGLTPNTTIPIVIDTYDAENEQATIAFSK